MCLSSPCFPTPAEVLRLENMGYRDELKFTAFADTTTGKMYMLVAPATTVAVNIKFGLVQPCVFMTKEGLCELHDLNLKPSEGRLASHNADQEEVLRVRLAACATWDTPEGAEIINRYATAEALANFAEKQAQIQQLFNSGLLTKLTGK